MDGEMYESPTVTENLKKVQEFGYHILEPASGFLASGLEGKGRLPEFEDILEKASEIISSIEGPLKGKKVVVTAGPTREFLDPVRFISNPSSGKMGFAMAEAAKRLGAVVKLIHGPVTAPVPEGIHSTAITSAADLFEAVKSQTDADIVIMAAAVSDFTPTQTFEQKIKKETGSNSIELKKTQDILAWLGEHKKKNQILIGFAMETEDLIQSATKKLTKKNADWIIANSITVKGAGFGVDTNHVHLISKNSQTEFQGTKQDVAELILGKIFRS